MKKTKTLCSYYGGSTLYHLMTPESDLDERGVFMHTDVAYILGTKRFDEDRKQDVDTDRVFKELSHFGSLVRKSNSEAMEVLYANESEFAFMSDEFKLIRDARMDFVDSTNLFKCLRGYMKGELRLACGERKGAIGGKRYAKLQEVGFSPKNATQLFRLAQVGITFFESDKYVVDTREFECELPSSEFKSFHSFLMNVKTKPKQFNVDDIKKFAEWYEDRLVTAWQSRNIDRNFNEDKLNELLLKVYFPVVKQAYTDL